nr:S8 family peptidase [Oceanipulchritudo coccoides]
MSLDAVGQWKGKLNTLFRESGITVSRDHILYPVSTTPDDPRFPEQWALEQIRAPDGWDLTTGSDEVIVAVLDTGLHDSHEDFFDGIASNLWSNPEDPIDGIDNDDNGFVDDAYGWDFVNETGTSMEDTHGHGTMVSGLLGARGNNGIGVSGVAWNMKILPMRAGAVSLPNSVLAQAMDYVTDLRLRGYPIVATSNSYGYYPYEKPSPEEWSATEVLGQAIERARQAGIMVITASGNGGQNNDSQYVRHFFPSDAIQHNVISVNALEQSGALWRGSNYGIESVDIAAPGLGVLTTYNDGGYRLYSGTSMAAPHVSGAAALLASLKPDLNTSWMRALILGTAAPHPSLDGKLTTGGSLDVAALLNLASLALDEAWKQLYWTEEELAAMTFSWDDNADSDAWSNLEELVFGGNPRMADSRSAFSVEEATFQRGMSHVKGFRVNLRYFWSPLADGLVSLDFESNPGVRGPWRPAIPVSHKFIEDDPATGLRTYEAEFLFPHSPAFMRLRLEPGPQKHPLGWGRAHGGVE